MAIGLWMVEMTFVVAAVDGLLALKRHERGDAISRDCSNG